MTITTFSYFALALVALAAILHVVRIRGRFPADSAVTSVSGILWIITAFVVIGSMINQATQHPESMDPASLLCGTAAAAFALLFGLDAVVPAIVATARHTNPATPDASSPPVSQAPREE